MIFRINELKDTCNIILSAVDPSVGSTINETLELKVENNKFVMAITNREYYVYVDLNVDIDDPNFHATVNADIFLKLISKITTDTVELKIDDNNLIIVGNGNYKLPMIYDGSKLLVLPEINISNVTVNFNIDGNILTSINKYNTKQLSMGTISRPIQKLYYVDEQGAVTFTSGACVNKFTLTNPVRMLLNSKLVKLFNLFKNKRINFSMGYDAISEDIIQTKARFEADNVIITAILSSNDPELNSFPVAAIRGRAFDNYDNSVSLNKKELLQTIDRLMLFPSSYNNRMYSKFIFSKDLVTIYDSAKKNKEAIYYSNSSTIDNEYEAILDLNDVKSTLDSFADQYVTFNFGNGQAVVLTVGNVYNVIPEITP